MALTASPAPANWGRWPQQIPPEFPIMDAPSFMPYDARASHAAHVQQRAMPQQYVVAPAYSNAPMAAMPAQAPHYQQQPFAYAPYHSSPPMTPIGSPFQQEFHERPMAGYMTPPRRGSVQVNNNNSGLNTPARSNSIVSMAPSVGSNPTANAKTITYNETIDPADRVNFETDVDELMKAIQAKEDAQESAATQAPTPAHTPRGDANVDAQSPISSCQASVSSSGQEVKPKKKWVCDGPSCNKRFVQKTHLDIHRRTHTGLKPYICTKPNCGLTFSQRGNLKTHMRRHTGEKPFSCSMCGKTFAQRGNVRSHEETHKGLKPFVCRLDDCNKSFSQLGNMKTHQNNFHKETLKNLTGMFVRFLEMGEVPEEHAELFEYFRDHYKNSNKGIKGRGKARTVAARKPKGSAQPITTAPMMVPHFAPAPPMDGDNTDYMPRNFGMFEHDGPTGGDAMLYDDDQARQMAFGGRMY